MRRALVIFLILLFPLNVAALCLSAASVQQPAGATEPVTASEPAGADAYSAGAVDWDNKGDPDTDEPPATADAHDAMNERIRSRFPVLPARALLPYAAPVYVHPSFPLIKPPPVA